MLTFIEDKEDKKYAFKIQCEKKKDGLYIRKI